MTVIEAINLIKDPKIKSLVLKHSRSRYSNGCFTDLDFPEHKAFLYSLGLYSEDYSNSNLVIELISRAFSWGIPHKDGHFGIIL